MAFRVGMKVECIDAAERQGLKWLGDRPAKGAQYTITDIGPVEDRLTGHVVTMLRLAEISNYPDGWYRAARFRPIVEHKTDISVFKAMLKPKKVEERV